VAWRAPPWRWLRHIEEPVWVCDRERECPCRQVEHLVDGLHGISGANAKQRELGASLPQQNLGDLEGTSKISELRDLLCVHIHGKKGCSSPCVHNIVLEVSLGANQPLRSHECLRQRSIRYCIHNSNAVLRCYNNA
jgi:hypothetical protein